MTKSPYRLAVIVASVRDGRFAPVVRDWFIDRASARPELELEEVDLVEVAAGPAFTASIGAADAVMVITPEYNHSFPGALKTAIDSVGPEWRGKPVAFVSYGGISGGLRAVEALRPVFAELHAVTIRETVSFHGAWGRFDADGEPLDAAEVDAALSNMLDQLEWWAESLREAREARPYVATF